MTPGRIARRALLCTLVLISLAFANASALRAHWDLDNIGTSRRYWEDLTVALSRYETRDWGPTTAVSIDEAVAIRITGRLKELVPRGAARLEVRPWQFWRTMEIRGFLNMAPFELRFSDDPGRAELSGIAFRILGGLAPYLPLWIAFIAFAPLVFWTMAEGLRAREGIAAFVFLLCLASSAYVLEALTLPYSAAGFHLLCALITVPLAFAAFGPQTSRTGSWVRVIVSSIALHGSTWCRSSSLIFLPVIAILLVVMVMRTEASSPRSRKAALALLVLAVLLAPRLTAPKQSHEFWVGMWEGLGDFDRERGHVWSDHDARMALDSEGMSMGRRGPYWTPETEGVFKRLVLRDVSEHPVWYAKILIQRVVATATQWRLRPTLSSSGSTYLAPQHVSEGFTDVYYNFVKTADVFVFLGRAVEAPLPLFWAMVVAFVLTRAAARRSGGAGKLELRVVLAVTLAALLMPVVVTTASGIEMQVFAFVYWLCGAFAVSSAVRRWSPAGSGR